MKSFIKEFKTFILRGNVLDLAVGVVIGGAFTAIVTSVVENLISPLIGLLLPDGSLAEWAPGGFGVGAVINAIITFLITAFVVFCIVKAVNKMMPKKEEAPAGPSDEVKLLTEIRDELKKSK